MGRVDKDDLHDAGQSGGNTAASQGDNDQSEEFLEEPTSPRFGLEIRMGLGILGVLGFILAAVIAYRLTRLKPAETGEKSSPGATTAAATSEANRSHPESLSGAPSDQTAALSPQPQSSDGNSSRDPRSESPPLALSTQGTSGRPSPPADTSPVTPQWPALPSSSMGESTSPGLLNNPSVYGGDDPNTANNYATLAPNQPVGGDPSGGVPPLPFGQTLDSRETPSGALNVRGWNLGLNGSPSNTESAGLVKPGIPAAQSPLSSAPGLAPAHDGDGGVSSNPFVAWGSAPAMPGDFFSGADPLTFSNNPNAAPSSVGVVRDHAALPPSLPWNANPTSKLPASDGNATALATSDLLPAQGNSGTAAPSSRSAPYAPPLVPSGQGANFGSSVADGPSAGRTYVVREGETLFDIARQQLGKASRWVEIYQLNRDRLGERLEFFRPGLTLILPPSDSQPGSPVR